MSATPQINAEAEEVRNSISTDVKRGSSALAEFSRRYARTPEYKNAALAIKDPESALRVSARFSPPLSIIEETEGGKEANEPAQGTLSKQGIAEPRYKSRWAKKRSRAKPG